MDIRQPGIQPTVPGPKLRLTHHSQFGPVQLEYGTPPEGDKGLIHSLFLEAYSSTLTQPSNWHGVRCRPCLLDLVNVVYNWGRSDQALVCDGHRRRWPRARFQSPNRGDEEKKEQHVCWMGEMDTDV